MYWGTGRECRYSGARRGIGGKRGHWGVPRGVGVLGPSRGHLGCQGCIGGLARECRYSGPEGAWCPGCWCSQAL